MRETLAHREENKRLLIKRNKDSYRRGTKTLIREEQIMTLNREEQILTLIGEEQRK